MLGKYCLNGFPWVQQVTAQHKLTWFERVYLKVPKGGEVVQVSLGLSLSSEKVKWTAVNSCMGILYLVYFQCAFNVFQERFTWHLASVSEQSHATDHLNMASVFTLEAIFIQSIFIKFRAFFIFQSGSGSRKVAIIKLFQIIHYIK